MPYANAYPALPPVADADARASLQGGAAPAFAAGDPLDEESLERAFIECQARETAGGVTRAEVNLARKRRHAIAREQAMDEYNALPHALPAGTPAWFGPAIAAALVPLTNQVTDLTIQVASIGIQVNAMQDELSRTRNEQLQAKNVAIFRNTTGQQLHRYLKVGNAVGPGLPVPRVVRNIIPVAAGAEYPHPQFPATIGGINAMTAQQMHELSIMMNNNFRVRARASVATCRTKLRDFLLFGNI